MRQNVTRRGFLGGLAALVAGTFVLRAPAPSRRVPWESFEWGEFEVPRFPLLWGDGIHDDTEAVQWYIDHARTLPPGRFYLRQPVFIPRGGALQLGGPGPYHLDGHVHLLR